MTGIGGAPPSAGDADRDVVRIVQVSDTHVSRKRAYFVDNWDLFVEEMHHHPPHLIVHSGDVSFDGADDKDDLSFARAEKDRLPAPWVAIRGNHDIAVGHPAAATRERRAHGSLAAALWTKPVEPRRRFMAACRAARKPRPGRAGAE
jgi:predicted MPP superfamily phosphohydrolase